MNKALRIVVHGGAWNIPSHLTEASVAGVRAASQSGFAVLSRGGSALDAVEAAVRSLEDDPAFDAGHGSVLTSDGSVEMDAVVMDGKTLNSGAVACVGSVTNPISLARMVMEETEHSLLVGTGANAFAREQNVPLATADDLVTPAAVEEYERFKRYGSTVDALFNKPTQPLPPPLGHDTVGAVAVDAEGNVAAATSTGGITLKRPGRVGDSPLVGSGAYADNEIGASSCTGHGESIMARVLALRVLIGAAEHVDDGLTSALELSCNDQLDVMRERTGGCGGVIAIGSAPDFTPVIAFSTPRCAWAMVGQEEGDDATAQQRYGIEFDELAADLARPSAI